MLEAEFEGSRTIPRQVAHALHRLALEAQVLHTDAFPGAFDDWTVDTIRAVQEAVDVPIVSGKQNEELQNQGKLLAGSRVEIAQVGFTVFVKKGAARPDLSSADALKRALLGAKSIAVGDPARGGGASLYTIGLLNRLGITEKVKAKTRLEASGTQIAEAVAKGEAELGIGVASDLSLVAGIESVALPAEVQNYSLYVAGINSSSKQVDAAKALIAYLTSPAVKQALTANGFEPR